MPKRIRTIVTTLATLSLLLGGVTTYAAEKDRSRSTRRPKARQMAVRPGRFEGPSIDGGKQQGTIRLRLPKIATDTTADTDTGTDTTTKPAATQKVKAPRTPRNVKDTNTATTEPDPVTQVQQELAAPPFEQGAFSSSAPTSTVVTGSPSSKRATSGTRTKQRGSATRSTKMRSQKPRMR